MFERTSYPTVGFYAALVLLLIILAPFQPEWTEHFVFESTLKFEFWRLLSAHFSHWNWTHWWLNFAALLCFIVIYSKSLPWRHVGLVLVTLLIMNAVLLLFFYQRDFYLGFSGLLYGLFIFAAIRNLSRQTILSLIVLNYLLAKVMSVYIFGEGATGDIGIPVAHEVHLFNALLGVFIAFLLRYKELLLRR